MRADLLLSTTASHLTSRASFAEAASAACPGEKASSASLIYVWRCSYAAAASTSVDPRYFKLPSFALNATQSYVVGVVVVDALGANNSAEVAVVVGSSALVATVEGGDRIIGISEVSKPASRRKRCDGTNKETRARARNDWARD